MRIVFAKNAYDAIKSEAAGRMNVETGGVFLGRYEDGVWYVIESIDPGPKAVFSKSSFEYDRQYIEKKANETARSYQTGLTLIGNWHKHLGSYDKFTATDDRTNIEYAGLSVDGAIFIIVNTDPEFRITPYHSALPLKYKKIGYEVCNPRLCRATPFVREGGRGLALNNYSK